MQTISDRIREILETMGKPERGRQARLAELAGCTRGLINQLLSNPSQQLGYNYAKNIEKALGYRVEWIMHGQLPKKAGESLGDQIPAVKEGVDGDEIIELVLLFRNATEPARERILNFARAADKVPAALRRVFPANNS